jgi:DHA2 family multidrug resistance protein-like MFS transporter
MTAAPTTTPGDAPRAGRREWTGLAVLALPTLLLSVDVSVLYLALPHLSEDLGASGIQQLWIMDIYGFMLAGLLVTMGTLGDRMGRRKLLLIGAAAFSAASVVAAFSRSAEMLIAARATLGIAGATLMPSTLALISNMFQVPRQRSLAIAVWMNCFLVGMAIAPLLGGLLLQHFWWGAAFLLGVPVMGLLLVTAPVLLPEYKDPQGGPLELTSVGLFLAAILPVTYGIKELARDGWHVTPLVAIAAGGAMGVAFVRRQRRVPYPLLDLRLYANPAFSATLVILLLAAIVMGGLGMLVPQYLQLVEGLSPLDAGLWMVPQIVAMMVSSLMTPVFIRRVTPATVMTVGLTLASIGCVLLTQVDSVDGRSLLVLGFVVTTLGLAPTGVLGTELVVSSAPPEKAGSAASNSETSSELGIALGVATLGSLVTTVYRHQLAGHVSTGLSPAVADRARESLVGALSAAEALPEPLRAALLGQAREAFTQGLNTAASISAVIFLGAAVLTGVMLRHVRTGHQAEARAPDA